MELVLGPFCNTLPLALLNLGFSQLKNKNDLTHMRPAVGRRPHSRALGAPLSACIFYSS